MVCVRILAASAALFIGISAAAAQTATDSAPGKPISLLPTAQPASTHAKTSAKTSHMKSAAKVAKKVDKKVDKKVHRKFAAKPVHHIASAAKAAESAPPAATAWPTLPQMPATDAAASTPALLPPAAPPPGDPQLSEMVVDGQTVHITSPGDVNEIDLAAAKTDRAPADAAKSDETAPAADPALATTEAASADASTDAASARSKSWYVEVFAALGGAVAAGSIAWFLIGSAPHRMYG